MTTLDHLKSQADFAYAELMTAIDGVTEGQSWSVLPEGGLDYLHTSASIIGATLHIASGKIMYASSCFLDGKYKWRDVAEEVESFEPNWNAAVEYLKKAQGIWMESWADFSDEELVKEVSQIRGRRVPAHRIIGLVTHHDGWHGGQIAILRYAVTETDQKPPSEAADIREHCRELPNW
jgi:hypothetical protein